LANEFQESPFEHRLASGVEEQLVEEPDAMAAGPTEAGKSLGEHERGGEM
jgi:hypothetical protein